MSNPVKYEDLVEGGVLAKVATDARAAIELLNEIISLQRETAKGGGGNSGGGSGGNGGGSGSGKKDYEDMAKAKQADIDLINKQSVAYKEYLSISSTLKDVKKTEADAVKAMGSVM